MESNENSIEHKVHPWRRLLAKYIDMLLFSVFGGLIVFTALDALGVNIESMSNVLLTIILLILFIPAEAAIIARTSSSFGKWLCGIRIRVSGDTSLPYKLAFQRSFRSMGQGLAFGVPLISLITLVQSYQNLKRSGSSKWDDALETEVVYSNFGILKKIAVILLLFVWLFLMYLGGRAS